MKQKYRLLGTSSSYEQMLKLIGEDYWYGSYVKLVKINDKEFEVYSHKGLSDSYRVIIKKGRYRFEIKEN